MYCKYFDYCMTDPVSRLGFTWRGMQITYPPLKTLVVHPIPGNAACLYAEYYGGRMFWDVCYDGVLVENPGGATFGDLFEVLEMIMKRQKKMLKAH